MAQLLAPRVDRIELISSFRLGTSSNAFYVSQFEITNRVSLAAALAKFHGQRAATPAASFAREPRGNSVLPMMRHSIPADSSMGAASGIQKNTTRQPRCFSSAAKAHIG